MKSYILQRGKRGVGMKQNNETNVHNSQRRWGAARTVQGQGALELQGA
jgi:hypothetical protein